MRNASSRGVSRAPGFGLCKTRTIAINYAGASCKLARDGEKSDGEMHG